MGRNRVLVAPRSSLRFKHDVAETLHVASQSRMASLRSARERRLSRLIQHHRSTIVQSEAELLNAFKARDLDHLMKKWSAICDPWLATYEDDPDTDVPISWVFIGAGGTTLEYPEDLGYLLAQFQEWTGESDWWQALRDLEEQVLRWEGFRVIVRDHSGAPEDPRLPYYPYIRKAPDNWTVAKWAQQRFTRYYPDLTVSILVNEPAPPYGTTLKHASPNRRLKTLRKMWEEVS